MKIVIKQVPAFVITIDGTAQRKIYRSKKTARRNIAWRLLYESNRLNKGDCNTFFDNSTNPTWANKHYECECSESISTYAGEVDGYDSSLCQLHNRHNGYYKRLHKRMVRWMEKGYMAPDSGLAEAGK